MSPHITKLLLWAGGQCRLSTAAIGDEEGPPFSPPLSSRGAFWAVTGAAGATVGAASAAVAWEQRPDSNKSGDRCDGEWWGPQGQREDGTSWGGTKAWRGLGNSSVVTLVRPVGPWPSPSSGPACQGPEGGFSQGPLPAPVKALCAQGFSIGSNPDL